MTQALNVEYQELMARADEIEQPLPAVPSTNPAGPCNLSFVNDAASRLSLNADTLRMYLKGCEREWKSLAKSLRNAAKAYEAVEEEAAEAISKTMNNDSATAGVTPASVAAEDEPWTAPAPSAVPPPFDYPYYEVRQAAADIESGDQGTAFMAFADEWDAFQKAFREESYRFRLFTSWEGEATAHVEQNFQQQMEWIYSMAKLCGDLGKQALTVVKAHKQATAKEGYHDQHSLGDAHPTSYEVSQCDYWYRRYMEAQNQYYVSVTIDWYERLQTQSETALRNYVRAGNLPLMPLNPDAPPKATVIKPPEAAKPDDTKPDATQPDTTPTPGPAPMPGLNPAQMGQVAGGLSQGMMGFSQGMQGVQSAVQGVQSLGQGAMGGGAIPADLASDTTMVDRPPADDAQLVDETTKDGEETNDETQRPETPAEGAAAGGRASGPVPTPPPAAGQSGTTPRDVVL